MLATTTTTKDVLNTLNAQQGHESEQRVLACGEHFLRTTSCEDSGRVPTMAGGWSKGSQHRGIWVLARSPEPNKSCFFSSNCACHVTERPNFLNKPSGASTEARTMERWSVSAAQGRWASGVQLCKGGKPGNRILLKEIQRPRAHKPCPASKRLDPAL